jgi:hypothetical protein
MEYLKDSFVAILEDEYKNEFKTIDFDSKMKFKNLVHKNPALKISFQNNITYNISCIKKIIDFKKHGIIFESKYNNLIVKYVISNATPEIIDALKVIEIENNFDKYTFLYDKLYAQLDEYWSLKNPCNFCNKTCIADRNSFTKHKINGCCYSFEYTKGFFHIINESKPVTLCKYLDTEKRLYYF